MGTWQDARFVSDKEQALWCPLSGGSPSGPTVAKEAKGFPFLLETRYKRGISSADYDGCTDVPIWTESECETFFADGRASTSEPCQVRIADGRIVVDAGGANGGWMYEGEEVGPEHFRLTSPKLGGTASLHRFEGDDVLDGGWREGVIYGMWRITLSKPENE